MIRNTMKRSAWPDGDMIHEGDVAESWGERLTTYVEDHIARMDLRYCELKPEEQEQAILKIVRAIAYDPLTQAGGHRHDEWERGWEEHLEMLKRDRSPRSLIPRYFGKHGLVRWHGRLIKPMSNDFEYNMMTIVQHWLFDKYLRNESVIYELGTGTGHNLLRMRQANAKATLIGLDWTEASYRLIAGNAEIFGARIWPGAQTFDFFNPRAFENPITGAAFFSCAALEQCGGRFIDLVDWIIEQKPTVVVHMEPLNELLDENVLMDYLSLAYAEKRGYLKNYLTHLRMLEEGGRIEIIEARRTGVGSLYLDGYQVVAWRPRP